ncbi:MAG: TetR/AcrR family transcriptional regulator [Cyanobacteria bacterium P01_H01_bin.153]
MVINVSVDQLTLSQGGNPKSEKARAILDGALQVFTTQGYSAASMDRIAAAANVSKSTLYSYFQDKEGLFLALVEDLTAARRREVFNLLSQSDLQAPPQVVLRQIANVMLDNAEKNQPLLTLMRLLLGESERFPKLARIFVAEIKKPMLDQLALYFASQTQLNLPDPMVAARIFSGSIVHYLIEQNLMGGNEVLPLECDRMVDGLVDLMTVRDQSA